jgi:hypothetical protein
MATLKRWKQMKYVKQCTTIEYTYSKMLYADAAITAADNSPPDTSAGIDDTPVVVGVNDPAPIVVNSAAPQPAVVHLS